MRIEEILYQRTDLSTFLVHLTRAGEDGTALKRLIRILCDGKIEARSHLGMGVQAEEKRGVDVSSLNVVCFTETPLQHVRLLTQKIEGRVVQFEPYGIAIPKLVGRRRGVNPVWYVDMTPGHDWLTKQWNDLINAALDRGRDKYPQDPVAKLACYVEQMGKWEERQKEFWWEREWRHVGNFGLRDRYIVLAPAVEFEAIREACTARGKPEPTFVDPDWSLEEIIAHLAGYERRDVNVFAE